MKTRFELEPEDIAAIADAVAKRLKGKVKPGRDDDQWFDVDGLCDYLKVGRDWIYAHQRELPRHRVSGRLIRYRKSEIDRWLKKKRVPGT